jgi:dicarboxylate transporter 10
MVADPTKSPEQQVRYRNALHGVYQMVKVEGLSSLGRGLAPNTVSPRLPPSLALEVLS